MGAPRLSDEEKKRRGTFRADQSADVYLQKDAAKSKVVTGPWLSAIPEPEYRLNKVGRAKYDEWTKELFEQGKLTKVSVTRASLAAMLHQKVQGLLEEGKYPSGSDVNQLQSAVRELDIATNAKITASPGANIFRGSGFSNSRSPTRRLLPPATKGNSEL